MTPIKIAVVVGTRPNFIKITQLENEFKNSTLAFDFILIHTGQHFDNKMSSVFFEQLQLKSPNYNLAVKENDRFKKVIEMQEGIKKVLEKELPKLLIVVGDVDSTYSAAMAAKELNIKIAHLESGLRSFDNRMPEEVNRIAVDKVSDLFFITEKSGKENLLNEGISSEKMHFVGNTMIDTLVAFDEKIKEDSILSTLKAQQDEYVLVTMHRPQNVDNKDSLELILNLISKITRKLKVIIPIHPRTRKQIELFGLQSIVEDNDAIIELGPIDYFAFQNLILNAKLVITDSGGIQEETTFRKVPCLTIRENTERPSTIELGSNALIELDESLILNEIDKIMSSSSEESSIPPLWDGKASNRIIGVLENLFAPTN